jgi:hypothetical protein
MQTDIIAVNSPNVARFILLPGPDNLAFRWTLLCQGGSSPRLSASRFVVVRCFAQKGGQTPDPWWFERWLVQLVGGQSPFLCKTVVRSGFDRAFHPWPGHSRLARSGQLRYNPRDIAFARKVCLFFLNPHGELSATEVWQVWVRNEAGPQEDVRRLIICHEAHRRLALIGPNHRARE